MKKWLVAMLLASAMCTVSCSMDVSDMQASTPVSKEDYFIDISLENETLTAEDVPVVDAENQARWAHQVNQFGYRFLTENYERDKNVVFSPVAMHHTLTMAAHGAVDDTYHEIQETLMLGEDRETASELAAQMMLNLRYDGQNENSQLVMANHLWLDKTVNVSNLFKADMDNLFKSPVQICNFVDYAFHVIKEINNWMEEITSGLTSLLMDGTRTESKQFMLVNATSFKGSWAYPFDQTKTSKSQFHGSTNKTIVEFMHLIYDFKYYENIEKGYQAIIIPYMDNVFDMVVILPYDQRTAQNVIYNITPEDFGTIFVEANETKLIHLSLPKFQASFEMNSDELIDRLKNIGVQEAFVEGFAKFDILSPSTSPFIDGFIHQAVIAVSESGTNTSDKVHTTMDRTEGDALQFDVNHAFAFALVHRSSGAVVYLGLMNNI